MNVGELRSTLMDEDGKLSETMRATSSDLSKKSFNEKSTKRSSLT